jgi:hypothetical protein
MIVTFPSLKNVFARSSSMQNCIHHVDRRRIGKLVVVNASANIDSQVAAERAAVDKNVKTF